jgi:predicted Zn-ribbon and HTH transcriptional regulator
MTNAITRNARRTKVRLVVSLQRELGDIAKLIEAEKYEDAYYDLDHTAEGVKTLDAWLRERLDGSRLACPDCGHVECDCADPIVPDCG